MRSSKDEGKNVTKAFQEWNDKAYTKTLQKFPEREKEFTTVSFEPIDPLYLPSDADQSDYCDKIGFPGEYPFTRGIQPTMYRGKFWTMRQYAGFGTAKESNERYRYLLAQGQTGLSIAFDLPTQRL